MIEYNRNMRNSAQIQSHPEWFKQHKATPGELSKQRDISFPMQPLFSVIVPLFNTPTNLFCAMVSVWLRSQIPTGNSFW